MGRTHFKFENRVKKINLYRVEILIAVAGVLLTGFLAYRESTGEENYERRSDGGKNRITVTATSENVETTVSMDILPVKPGEEECREKYDEFLATLKKTILCENASFEEVRTKLSFPDEIDGYPFGMEYRVYPKEYISRDGAIIGQPEESVEFSVEINISCDYFDQTEEIYGILWNSETEEERFERQINAYLQKQNEENRTQKEIVLENTVNGREVSWETKKKSSIPKVITVCVLLEVFIFAKKRVTKHEEEKERKEKIVEDYPEFAMKYALLFNAGLPHMKVLEKIVSDSKKSGKKGPLYEETEKALHESERGVSSLEALRIMAEKCDVREVKYFTGLICQNIRKGGKDIEKDIKSLAKDSMNIKRDNFKKKAETAGTKLTIPMVILLVIVFVIIMVPAFSQMSF